MYKEDDNLDIEACRSKVYNSMLCYYRAIVNSKGLSDMTSIFFDQEIKKLCNRTIVTEFVRVMDEDKNMEGIHFLEDYGYSTEDHEKSLNEAIVKFKKIKKIDYIRPHVESGKIKLIRDTGVYDTIPSLENAISQ